LTATPAAVRGVLRRQRADSSLLAPYVASVCLISLALCAGPMMLNRMSDDGIRAAVRDAPIARSALVATTQQRLKPGTAGAAFADEQARGDNYAAQLPASVHAVLGGRNYLIESPYLLLIDEAGQPLYASRLWYARLRFRYEGDVERHARLSAGRLPQRHAPETAPDGGVLPVLEVALSEATAGALELSVGSRVLVTPDLADPLAATTPSELIDVRAVVEVVGVFAIDQPDDPFWFGDTALARPGDVMQGEQRLIYAAGLLAPETYADVYHFTAPIDWRYSWRYAIAPATLDEGQLNGLAGDLRRLETTLGPGAALTDDPTQLTLHDGLPGIIAEHQTQLRLTLALLSFVAIGFSGLALALLGLLAALVAERRRAQVLLVRGRGASLGQLVPAQITEALLLTIPAALLGLLAARWLTVGRASVLSFWAALGVVVVATSLLTAAAFGALRRPLASLERDTPRRARFSVTRNALEVAVMLLALAGVYLLRRRGMDAARLAGSGNGFDVYLSATPVLLGLAVGLRTVRVYGPLVELLGRIWSLRRGLPGWLGLRRVARLGSVGRLPLAALVVAVAVSVFAGVVRESIARGQQAAAWQTAGADFRIASTVFGARVPDSLKPDDLGLRDIALGYETRVTQADVDRSGKQAPPFRLVALDAEAYARVARDSSGAPRWPSSFAPSAGREPAGTPDDPIPVIASRTAPAGVAVARGDTFAINFNGARVTLLVADVRERFPGAPLDEAFVVASYSALRAMPGGERLRPTLIYARGSERSLDTVRAIVARQWPTGHVVSRREELARVADAPLVAGVGASYRLSMLAAAIVAALASIAALSLTARERTRDLSYLRTLGLSARQALAVTLIEQLPTAFIAGLVGALLGEGMAWAIRPGIDLTTFTGPGISATLEPAWLLAGAVAGAVTLVTLAAGVLFSIATRRERLEQVLRVGD
jgi:putative ABC transport system permease protein